MHNLDKNKDQAGITLLISIMILSSVAIISFSLGSLAIREIRASRIASQSEPAIVAAEAGGEKLLFFRMRGLTDFAALCPSLNSDSYPAGSSYEACNDLYDDPYYFQSYDDNVSVVLLNNPIDPNSSIAGYSNITINATTSDNTILMRAYAFNLDNLNECPRDSGIFSSNPGTGNFSSQPLDPNKRYAVFLYPCANPGEPPQCNPAVTTLPACTGNEVVRGSITGSTSLGATGIPSENPKIQSSGAKSSLIRKLEVLIGR